MQTLLNAVLQRFNFVWPAPEGSDLYFSCDPDGEVRQRGDWVREGGCGTEFDFYPSVEVSEDQRSVYFGPHDVRVNEKIFKEAVDKIKQAQ